MVEDEDDYSRLLKAENMLDLVGKDISDCIYDLAFLDAYLSKNGLSENVALDSWKIIMDNLTTAVQYIADARSMIHDQRENCSS